MNKQEKEKICFVIAPIGEEGSEARRRSDQILKHIMIPAAKECGYETVRADTISEPGMITSQVIQHLVEDALVIADLTGRNPNVFYELAVRHAIKKPCVQVIQIGEPIPFDVAQSRTIQVDHHDLDSVARCISELVKQIHSVEKNPSDVDTPISVAIDLQSLRQSENPLEKSSAEIISMLQDLRSMVGELSETSFRRAKISPAFLDEFALYYRRMQSWMNRMSISEKINRAEMEEPQIMLNRIYKTLEMSVPELNINNDCREDFILRRTRSKKNIE